MNACTCSAAHNNGNTEQLNGTAQKRNIDEVELKRYDTLTYPREIIAITKTIIVKIDAIVNNIVARVNGSVGSGG